VKNSLFYTYKGAYIYIVHIMWKRGCFSKLTKKLLLAREVQQSDPLYVQVRSTITNCETEHENLVLAETHKKFSTIIEMNYWHPMTDFLIT
jgi:hypothetical protein